MAFMKLLELNLNLQTKLTEKLNELEEFYSKGRSTFILKEILKVTKELINLKNEENGLRKLYVNSKTKKLVK